MSDTLAFLALPFAASVVFVFMHAYLGVHVLRRKIVFADLALAQLSALGATVAFASGYPAASAAGFGCGRRRSERTSVPPTLELRRSAS